MSNFQWVLRCSCLNVMHKKPYKRYEGKTNDLLIAFIGYVNDLNKLQQFRVSVKNPSIDFNALFNSLGNSTVLVFLLFEGSTIHNVSNQIISCVHFFFEDFTFHPFPQTKIGSVCTNFKQLYLHTHIENWTLVCMNLFTQNSPYYHLLKYLLFLLKHPVYKLSPIKHPRGKITLIYRQ